MIAEYLQSETVADLLCHVLLSRVRVDTNKVSVAF